LWYYLSGYIYSSDNTEYEGEFEMNDIRYAECPTPDNAILARRLKMIGKIMSVLCVLNIGKEVKNDW